MHLILKFYQLILKFYSTLIIEVHVLLLLNIPPTNSPFLFKKINASNKSSFILVLFADIINPASLKTRSLTSEVA